MINQKEKRSVSCKLLFVEHLELVFFALLDGGNTLRTTPLLFTFERENKKVLFLKS